MIYSVLVSMTDASFSVLQGSVAEKIMATALGRDYLH
jgi:hypothetical protein